MRIIKWFSFLLSFLTGLILSAQGPADRPHCRDAEFDKKVASSIRFSIPLFSCEELYSATEKGEDIIILDAREPKEYETSHIPGAKYIGYDHFSSDKLKHLPLDSKIVVYCSIGYRSEKIAERIQKEGFSNVYNLYGSIFEWGNLGYPLVDQNENATIKVHTYNTKWSKWLLNPDLEKVY
jgi:rhodanese-related sulfurtransferase